MDTSGERFIPNSGMGREIEIEHMHRYMAVAPKLKGLSVLDAACGAGYGSRIISEYAKNVVGIDIDPTAVSYAHDNYGNENSAFLVMSVTELEFPNSSFDAVVSFETIEHISEQSQEHFLNEVRRVLRPGGILIISTPDLDVCQQESEGQYGNPYHIKEYGKNEFQSFLHKYFRDVKVSAQERIECSVIEGAETMELNKAPVLERGKYIIAVCSNEYNSLDIGSVLFPSTDRSEIKSFLYLDTGDGYSEKEKVSLVNTPSNEGEFQIEYTFEGDAAKELRFDPVDYPASVQLSVVDEIGSQLPFVPVNANYYDGDKAFFMHWDPQYICKEIVFEQGRKITLRGRIRKITTEALYAFWTNKLNEQSQKSEVIYQQLTNLERMYSEQGTQLLGAQDELKMQSDRLSQLKQDNDEKKAEIIALHNDIEKCAEQEERLERRLEEKNSIIANYESILLEKQEYLDRILKDSKEKEKKIHQLGEQITDKENEIKQYQIQLTNLSGEKESIEEQYRAVSKALADTWNSKSWRITKPLRLIIQFVISIRNYLKAKRISVSTSSIELPHSGSDKVALPESASVCYRTNLDNVIIPQKWLEMLRKQYSVSIIIAVKRIEEREELFKKCLRSIENQIYRNIRLIIVCEKQEYQNVKGVTEQFPDINKTILTFDSNLERIQDYWAVGLKAVDGDYFGFIEQEDYIDEMTIAFMVESANEYPDAKILTVKDDVIWDDKGTYPDNKLGIEFKIGGEESVFHFSLFHKKLIGTILSDTSSILEGIQKDDVKVIPGCFYHSTAIRDVWNRNFDIRCIAFYLPQFHAIPENDKWWGTGFTEWTNVKKAMPLYEGHNQPRVPAEDIGYYDLGDEKGKENQLKQIKLAEQYNISGFCYYYYWFDNGQRLLEKPLDRHLNSPEMDFPFCLCWANENWTRSWDGLNREVLMPQTYLENWEKGFVQDILPYVTDNRYICINGAPFILIYNLQDIPNPQKSLAIIREEFVKNGIERIHLSAVRRTLNSEELHISGYTLDSLTDFPPHMIGAECTIDDSEKFGLEEGHVKDYKKAVKYHSEQPKQYYTYFRTAMLQWDNTARRGKDAYLFENYSFSEYKKWLYAIRRYMIRQNRPGENLMFINAWNEWAEGTYLEPDEKNGYMALSATKEILEMK